MISASLIPAERAASVSPFHVMRILERAKALEAKGRDVIHMEVGEPDFATPEPMMAAAREALNTEPMGYTPAAGLPKLRRAIAEYYGQRYNLDLNYERVIVTPGGSGALQLALAALLDVGDRVLTADPGYPCNRHLISLAGGQCISVPVVVEDGYQYRIPRLESYWGSGVRALMLATPANPTGAVTSPELLDELAAYARSRQAALIVDEIYQGLTYAVEDCTALSYGDDNIFVVNSFSKYFGMTGWRLGWLVVPPRFAEAVQRLAQNLYLAPPTLAQYAALAAFEPETLALLDRRRDIFQARRDLLLAELCEIGFTIPLKPEGAYYLYVIVPEGLGDAADLADQLLEQVSVAVTPGLDFGSVQLSKHMLRFAYATDADRLRTATKRIRTITGAATRTFKVRGS